MTGAGNPDLGEGLVFLIASHRNPDQVIRLSRRLRRDLPASVIVIHHDQSKSRLEHDRLPAQGVELITDSVAGAWGGGSLVRIVTAGLRHVVAAVPAARWVVFLSGQDYPLRHLGALPAHLETMRDGYLEVWGPGLAEPLRYTLAWFRVPAPLHTPAVSRLFDRLMYHLNDRQRLIRFANGRLGPSLGIWWPSPLPAGMRVRQGSQWWTLSRRAVDAYLAAVRDRPRVYDWFVHRTIVPDEAVVQTLLSDRSDLAFADRDIRYLRWDDRSSGSPATFTSADLPELRASGCFLGRKFDADVDAAVLDALDAGAA